MDGGEKRSLRRGQPPGEQHSQARLTEAQVREIHARACGGDPHRQLAAEFSVHTRTIEAISKGATWKHLGLPPIPTKRGSERPGARLTEVDINLIRARIQSGDTITEVARDCGVSRTTISNIWHGKTWSHVQTKAGGRRRAWE